MDEQTEKDPIAFALEKEREAVEFYAAWSERAEDLGVRRLFAELAEMERGHVARLSRVSLQDLVPNGEAPPDLGLAPLMVEVQATPDLTLQEAFVVAIKREQASVALYEGMSRAGGHAREVMARLAEDERRHKRLLEEAYERAFLAEN